jgi:hypothetical protein
MRPVIPTVDYVIDALVEDFFPWRLCHNTKNPIDVMLNEVKHLAFSVT